MKRPLRRLALLLAAMLALTITGALPATAITGGEPDGNRHPNVGMIAFYFSPDDPLGGGLASCSATLISPTILLTAAHCATGTTGAVLVTFESFIAENHANDIIPDATDPDIGYTPEELEAAGFLWGTPLAHPDYSNFTDIDNWNDVGIIVLNEPVTDITPATLAPENYLDQFEPSVLNHTIFELVGYGTVVRKPESGPQKPQPMLYPNFRRYTTAPGQKLTPQILQLQGNPNDNRGGGGTCFGDSGGPVFLNGYLVAVTSYTLTPNCRYLGGYQRVDIPVVQDWLDEYL
ncbi:hypothetical protein QF038_001607 [Pseudarthrobacter sp. W1I19]|uniref:trypsin-like serine protease n=1 Tax=Pseudarthrobacter sp. W1I19 TaxID=3042288 RepID=UPI002785CE10|nr:trypsin-like serine protease [Pseudarthrobacter sp. W1I19]MDQ0923099.1 hypothetical protein [Pseudarthrobacter sp. W1I19]